MQIIPVNDTAGNKLFLSVPLELYKNDPLFIRPLDKDINEIFDKQKNKAFRFGKAMRWILQDDKGKLIGRIAAFTNSRYKNKGDDQKVAGIGFFECINDQAAADLLFDNAKHWLLQNGVEAMDGPINFGERDRFWGLVIQGFKEPLYCMNYNPAYYKELFENYGFRLFYNQVCFGIDPKKSLNPKIIERHARFKSDKDFVARQIDKSQLQKFAIDFATVYNKAWAGHGGLKELSKEQVGIMFKKMKPVMDERIIWFVYHKEEPIAMYVSLPDLNQWFKKLNGKFGVIHKLYFLWLKAFVPNKKFTGLVFGVIPEWQGKGIDAFMIQEASLVYQTPASPYTDHELQWIGDFNPKMINIAENLGDVFVTRTLATYRYNFDRAREFKRHPILH